MRINKESYRVDYNINGSIEMRLIDAKWKDFYDEIKYESRNRFLAIIEAQEELTPEELFAKEVFEKRYSKDGEVDNFIRSFLDNMYLYRFRFSKKKSLKLAYDTLHTLMVDCAKELGESYEDYVYWEIRNVTKLYLWTSNDPSYNKKTFGLITSSEGEKQAAVIQDLLEMSYGVAHKVGIVEEMELFSTAIEDEIKRSMPQFTDLDSIKEKILEDIEKKKFTFF